MNLNLARPFYESARSRPDKLALVADGQSLTYAQLLQRVATVAAWLKRTDGAPPERVGILASRSVEACIGVLAAAWAGAAYVALNLKQPESALVQILERTNLSAIIADRIGSKLLTHSVLSAAPQKVLAVAETASLSADSRRTWWHELSRIESISEPVPTESNEVAYIIFTSGSTGKPKGVMVSTGAVESLLREMEQQFPVSFKDRFAETTDISFDLSVYNMFAAWRAGASLHLIPPTQAIAPAKFLRDQGITVWLSVPSIAAFMKRMGLLTRGAFPDLRLSFFAGEPLLMSVAQSWQEASPNAIVANLYGPTEGTVVVSGEILRRSCAVTRDCLAIGKPFTNMTAVIVDSNDNVLPSDVPGELLISGPQLASGYFDDPATTASKFVMLRGQRWYRSGDRCSCDSNGTLHYRGRIDNQVKIVGYRVELEDIESHLRNIGKCETTAAVPWPISDHTALGVVAFMVSNGMSESQIKSGMQSCVPSYMVPSRVYFLPELPMNTSGKVNRKALVAMLENGGIK